MTVIGHGWVGKRCLAVSPYPRRLQSGSTRYVAVGVEAEHQEESKGNLYAVAAAAQPSLEGKRERNGEDSVKEWSE